MASSYCMPVCKCCGTRDMLGSRTMDGEFPPVIRAEFSISRISSFCSESPTKKHQVEWLRYK